MKRRDPSSSKSERVALLTILSLVCALSANTALAQSETTVTPTVETVRAEVERVGGAALEIFEPVVERGLHGFFELLDKQPFVFLLLALAIGYPLGRLSIRGISLGPTAGTLLSGVVIAVVAKLGFDITYSIPGLVATIFMLLFMYALGLKVGPQFFAGLRSGAFGLIIIALKSFTGFVKYIDVLAGLELSVRVVGHDDADGASSNLCRERAELVLAALRARSGGAARLAGGVAPGSGRRVVKLEVQVTRPLPLVAR